MTVAAFCFRAGCLLGAVLLLGACGFQLRGSIDLPAGMEPLYVSAGEPLASQLNNALAINGVTVVASASEARHQLVILKQNSENRALSLGENARVAEYQLIETVEFIVRNRKGETVFGPVVLRERAVLQNDPDKVVSTGRERQLLQQEMRQNLAGQITRQLGSIPVPAMADTDAAE